MEYGGYEIKLVSTQGRVEYQVWKRIYGSHVLKGTFKTRREAIKWIDNQK